MDLKQLIAEAYAEDIPSGDITTSGLGLKEKIGTARLVAKEDLVLSGLEVFSECVHSRDSALTLKWQFKDADLILNQQTVCLIKGNLLTLLQAERVALNFLGHLSGIATLTRCFAQAVSSTKCKILDTRKTMPLLRALEKSAVRDGGGENHRMNLSDAILIKENHIRAAGSLTQAVRSLRQSSRADIEVECSTLQEVELAMGEKVQRILLDNMSAEEIHAARKIIPSHIQIEASGNMTLDRVAEVAATGVDYISVGALTHSAPCADFSLLFDWPNT